MFSCNRHSAVRRIALLALLGLAPGGPVHAGAKLEGPVSAFVTRVLDGDTIVCLPERDGEVDRALLEIHGASVKQAQEARCELMRTIVEAAARLTGPGR